MSTDGEKACINCSTVYPATPEFFGKDSSTSDGFRSECKQCRAIARKEKKYADLENVIEQFDKATLNAISALTVKPKNSDERTVEHIATLFEHMMNGFGGAEGFSKHFILNFMAAKPGSAIRQKQMDAVLSLGKAVTNTGAAQVPLELLTDEDLEREYKKRNVEKIIEIDLCDKEVEEDPDDETSS